MLRFCALIFSLFCLNAFSAEGRAVIFGDSLADEGRIYALTNGAIPQAPYFDGRFSDGPTWPEYAYEDRENYSYAGAKSDHTNHLATELGSIVDNTGLLGQVEEYIAAHPDKETIANTVFYISIGGNDILGLSTDDEETLKFLITGILQNIKLAMHTLEAAGAEHFAFIGLPDLAVAPVTSSMSKAERALLTTLSNHFNEGLRIMARRYDAEYIDMDAFVSKIIRRPGHYGFTNVTDACYDEHAEITADNPCQNPQEYLFWDGNHPTTRVHALFADSLE